MIEKRAFTTELRTKGRRLTGYAALFGAEARIGPDIIETIAPGSFAVSLRTRDDILALVDHDPTRVLARTRSGSLRLSEDTRGLAFDLDVPDTQAGRDVLTMAQRGDLGGMSFGFNTIEDIRDGNRRELRQIDLREISIVSSFPAYEGTIIDARSRAMSRPGREHAERSLRIMELMT